MNAHVSRGVLAVVTAVLAATMTASAAVASPKATEGTTIQLKLASPMFFLPATPSCPAGRARTRLTTIDGRTVGALESCIQSFMPTGPNSQVVDLQLTFRFSGGVIDATVVDSETFDDSFTTITESWDGTVTGGSGLYAGATGTLGGGGTLSFLPDGSIAVDIVAVIDLA